MNFAVLMIRKPGGGEIQCTRCDSTAMQYWLSKGQAPGPVRIHGNQRGQVKPFGLIYLKNYARMAKSADAADLKSAGRKAVGVQVPLWAPI
jgi:hypothetical protein